MIFFFVVIIYWISFENIRDLVWKTQSIKLIHKLVTATLSGRVLNLMDQWNLMELLFRKKIDTTAIMLRDCS